MLCFVFIGIIIAQPVIHLVDITGNPAVATIVIDSPNPINKVCIMQTRDVVYNGKWVTIKSFTTEEKELSYPMPTNLTKRRYYAFKLKDAKGEYFTKPMYYDRLGNWLSKEKGDIERAKNENKTQKYPSFSYYKCMGLVALYGILY